MPPGLHLAGARGQGAPSGSGPRRPHCAGAASRAQPSLAHQSAPRGRTGSARLASAQRRRAIQLLRRNIPSSVAPCFQGYCWASAEHLHLPLEQAGYASRECAASVPCLHTRRRSGGTHLVHFHAGVGHDGNQAASTQTASVSIAQHMCNTCRWEAPVQAAPLGKYNDCARWTRLPQHQLDM